MISASVLGTYLSLHIDLATGGTIVVSEAVLFVLAYLCGARGVLRQRAARQAVCA